MVLGADEQIEEERIMGQRRGICARACVHTTCATLKEQRKRKSQRENKLGNNQGEHKQRGVCVCVCVCVDQNEASLAAMESLLLDALLLVRGAGGILSRGAMPLLFDVVRHTGASSRAGRSTFSGDTTP
jgi:hypothetical protein